MILRTRLATICIFGKNNWTKAIFSKFNYLWFPALSTHKKEKRFDMGR